MNEEEILNLLEEASELLEKVMSCEDTVFIFPSKDYETYREQIKKEYQEFKINKDKVLEEALR